MRKRLLALILPLFLLLSQQGAVWHEIGHLSDPAPAGPQKHSPDDKPCGSCVAFAHLAAAAKPEPVPLPLADLGHAQADAVALAFFAGDAPAPRSRGPPAYF